TTVGLPRHGNARGQAESVEYGIEPRVKVVHGAHRALRHASALIVDSVERVGAKSRREWFDEAAPYERTGLAAGQQHKRRITRRTADAQEGLAVVGLYRCAFVS